MLSPNRLDTEAVLRVGAVSGVTGRRVLISVDTDKNLSELFFDGDVLRNIAVGSYIDIRKGFLSLIGKVEGENARGDDNFDIALRATEQRRILTVALVGFLDHEGRFFRRDQRTSTCGQRSIPAHKREDPSSSLLG